MTTNDERNADIELDLDRPKTNASEVLGLQL